MISWGGASDWQIWAALICIALYAVSLPLSLFFGNGADGNVSEKKTKKTTTARRKTLEKKNK